MLYYENSEEFISQRGADAKTLEGHTNVLDKLAVHLSNPTLSPIDRAYFELQYYVQSVDLEIKNFFACLALLDGRYTTIDKYLVLLVCEATETTQTLVTRLLGLLEDDDKTFDAESAKQGFEQFKKRIRDFRKTLDIDKDLEEVRNATTAHHLDTQNSIDALVRWYLSTRAYFQKGGSPLESPGAAFAVEVDCALADFSNILVKADLIKRANQVKDYISMLGLDEASLNEINGWDGVA